jgi:hypothetical protein
MLRKISKRLANIPDVFASVGWENRVTFISHPGVMALSKLLEQNDVTRMKATFNQELIQEIAEHDEELARKAQIAYDNNISVEWKVLENIEAELPRLLKEKQQIEAARAEILGRKKGDFDVLKSNISEVVPTPKNLGGVLPNEQYHP